jgi:(E)-4-hydroxy-3-methylbut-2-enyl-diphosphate synthase
MDTDACVRQTLDLVAVGCEIVRITVPTVKDAANLKNIKQALRSKKCDVPIVADVHFKPEVATEAAQWVEKIRINPGNFADKKKFQAREYTDAQYKEELERIEETFTPLVIMCQQRGIAMRIGTNHGSLSDRIMNRFGDTPLGMVESALEYAHIAHNLGYNNLVFSMKASNPKIMIAAYRLLVSIFNERGWDYPLHLGVTEAGDAEDGRIKSAVGIGSLLLDGLGDTIRVSLTEDSVHEIPVAQSLVRSLPRLKSKDSSTSENKIPFSDPFSYQRRQTSQISVNQISLGANEPVRVVTTKENFSKYKPQNNTPFPELSYEDADVVEIDPNNESEIQKLNENQTPYLVTVKDNAKLHPVSAFRALAAKLNPRHPILLKDTLRPENFELDENLKPKERKVKRLDALIASSMRLGSLICDGIGDAVYIRCEPAPEFSIPLSYGILQACGNRTFKTEYVACPSCGRTLFDLQSTVARIKETTQHLKDVKIAIMGCIVNGPGEMADADFGYVGGAPGKINLYVNKTPVKFNIPEAEAVDRLKDLIKEHGKWVDP